MGICASWADGITMCFCNAVQLLFGLNGMLFGFLLLSSSSVFNQQRFRADGVLFPQLHKALFVSGKQKRQHV